ncbi:YraN family protein [Polaribacter sp.]|nr:YraN family protein [Polaribacter sp.]
MADHNELGKKGEQLAIDFLTKNNYIILEKNYRYLKAEIDIIAKKKDVLVAVEVKTRTSNYFGNPQDFVNPKKIKLMVSAIDNYVNHFNLDVEVRFDVIAIITNAKQTKIEHLKDAFFYF